jgi:SAM-dependent methyltransferase
MQRNEPDLGTPVLRFDRSPRTTAAAHRLIAVNATYDRCVTDYYARRACEYDATSWEAFDHAERETVERFVTELPAGRILDIGCGTGYLTRLLPGTIVGVDASAEMLTLARARMPEATFVQAEVPPLPFPDDGFDLAFSSNVYSHIDRAETCSGFVAEALRVAPTLIILEQAWRRGLERAGCEPRRLLDGSEYQVFKRYFTAQELAGELSGSVALDSPAFVAARVLR